MLNRIILLNSSNSINYFVKIQLITYMYILKIWVSNVDGLSKNGFVGSEETNNMSCNDNAAISHKSSKHSIGQIFITHFG